MTKLTKDLETLTGVPEAVLAKLFSNINYCICNSLIEGMLANDEVINIDIGIGMLSVIVTGNELKMKFTPNAKLNTAIIKTIKTKTNPLVAKVESSLIDKITNIYKDFL